MRSLLIGVFATGYLAMATTPVLAQDGEILTVQGKLTGRDIKDKRVRYKLAAMDGRVFTVSKSRSPSVKVEDYRNEYVTMTGTVTAFGQDGDKSFRLEKITSIEKLEGEDLEAFRAALAKALAREFEPSPNAKPFMGTWGPRVCIPSAMSSGGVDRFDVEPLMKQISQLSTASYVMANVTQPAGGCYFTGPHPALAEALKLKRASFPTRDVLGMTLDALQADGKKALVYFGAKALHAKRASSETKAAWDKHIESLGMTHHGATRKLILKHYAERYGTKIAGWWFDGSGDIEEPERVLWRKTILASNPKAIIVFNRMAGAPYRSTKQCDYFGGHTTPIVKEEFWSMANERMITDIEASPWMGIRGNPVKEGYGALGHVFVGMQNKWTIGKCRFPPKQATDWTTRVLAAGGMYTWAVPLNRTIPQIPSGQFALLLKIDKAAKQAKLGQKSPLETEEGSRPRRKKGKKREGKE